MGWREVSWVGESRRVDHRYRTELSSEKMLSPAATNHLRYPSEQSIPPSPLQLLSSPTSSSSSFRHDDRSPRKRARKIAGSRTSSPQDSFRNWFFRPADDTNRRLSRPTGARLVPLRPHVESRLFVRDWVDVSGKKETDSSGRSDSVLSLGLIVAFRAKVSTNRVVPSRRTRGSIRVPRGGDLFSLPLIFSPPALPSPRTFFRSPFSCSLSS